MQQFELESTMPNTKKESSFSEMFDSGDITTAWVAALNSGKLTSEYSPDKEPDEVKSRLQKMNNVEDAECEEVDLGVDGLGIHVTVGRKKGRSLTEEMDASHQDKRSRKATEGDLKDLDDYDNLDDIGDAEDIELMMEAHAKAMSEPLDGIDTDAAFFDLLSSPSALPLKSDSASQESAPLTPLSFTSMLQQITPFTLDDGFQAVAPPTFPNFGVPSPRIPRINGRKVRMHEVDLTSGEQALENHRSMCRFRVRFTSPLRICWSPADELDAREENTLVDIFNYGADISSSGEAMSIVSDGATIDENESFF